jgi:integrase
MGQIRKRGRVYWIRYYRNGRRHEESAGSDNYEKARDLLRLREGAIAKGAPITAKMGQLRFDEAAQDFLNDYETNGKRALEHVKRRVELALKPWFGGRRMASISTADVRAYVKHRQEAGAANATINRELAALKRMFSLAMQAEKLMHRPYIPMLREDNVRRGFFEREQFESVREHLPEPVQPIVTVAYLTGWRVKSEILPLKWAQVDRKACEIRLEPGTTKNREGRTFVYAGLDELKQTIEDQWKAHEALKADGVICPYVFFRVQRKKKRIVGARPIKFFRRVWLAATVKAGCPGRVPHDFRRTAVRNLVRAGVSEKVAMAATGHLTRSVFDRYDIVAPADLAAAAEKLNRLSA